MKKTIITGILFLAIVSISAQEKGTKNTKPIKYNKETNNNEVKPNKFTKVIITPTSSNNSNRISQSQNDQLRPEKPVREKEERVINNRASQSQNDQLRLEKPVREKEERVINNRVSQSQNNTFRPEKPISFKEKEERVINNRAAQSDVVTDRPERIKEEKPRKEKPSKKERKERKEK